VDWIDEWLEKNPAPKKQAREVGVEISYSQLRCYLECPWQYKLRYKERWRSPHTPASALGVSIHRALEAYHRGGGGTLDDLHQAYEESWVHEGFPDPATQMEWYKKGEDILDRFHAQDQKREGEIEYLEREFFFPLGPHMVRGIVDRIDRRPDGTVEVIDYKTFPEAKGEEEVKENLQLTVYGLGAEEGLGLDPKWLSLYFVAVGKKVTVPYDRERAAEVRRLFERVADCIALGKKYPPDTSFCGSCGLAERCSQAVSA
jgi:DNA helicase-2/ATP-dependent DNA helicase PcrA